MIRLFCLVLVLLAGPVLGAQTKWPLWNEYSARFISPEGRVIDHNAQDHTTSEGQSYAMFFALVANDRSSFDRLLAWTGNNLAAGSLSSRLPGWEWGKGDDGNWHILDTNSAADSDLWIAYDLLEAGRLWHDARYTTLGRNIAANIAREEVVELPGFGTVLSPGGKGFHPAKDQWVLNPSYSPLPVLTALANLEKAGPWRRIAGNVSALLQQSVRRGIPMDWVTYSKSTGFQPSLPPGRILGIPVSSYDAIRVYLWAGLTNAATPGRDKVLKAIPGMSEYLATGADVPEIVNENGLAIQQPGPPGFYAALLPYLAANGNLAAQQRCSQKLSGAHKGQSQLFGYPAAYYDQNLALYGTGWLDGYYSFAGNGDLQVKW
jgi:endoglucanase